MMRHLLFVLSALHAAEPAPQAPTTSAPTLARARAAAELPALAERLRAAGVEPEEVRDALQSGRGAGTTDTVIALQGAAEAAEDGVPVEHLGHFVKARLDEGLRGTALADAIHAEHDRRKAEKRGAHGKSDDEHGRDGEHGKSEVHGRPGEHGKAGGAKSDERGGPDSEHGREGGATFDGRGKAGGAKSDEHGKPDAEHGKAGSGKSANPGKGGKASDPKGGGR